MVNNAGIVGKPSIMHEATEEEWDKLMNVNARSVFLGSKYAIAQMLKQPPHSSGDRGWIINMSSCAGTVGVPGTRMFIQTYPPIRSPFSETLTCSFYSNVLRFQRCRSSNDETSCSGLWEASNPLQRNLSRM